MIEDYGWSDALAQQFSPHHEAGLIPGRVVVQQRGLYGLMTELGEVRAKISGKLAREAEAGGYPAAGDWVALSIAAPGELGVIHHWLTEDRASWPSSTTSCRAAPPLPARPRGRPAACRWWPPMSMWPSLQPR